MTTRKRFFIALTSIVAVCFLLGFALMKLQKQAVADANYQRVSIDSVAGEEEVWSNAFPYDHLIDGRVETECSWGSWGVTDFYQAYMPVTLTLSEETIVDRVTITLPSNLPQHTIAFTIEASLDNSKWIPVNYIENETSKIMNNAVTVASREKHVITADFDAVAAKYLKVTAVVKDTNNDVAVCQVSEIEVFKSATATAPSEIAYAEKVNYTAEITKGALADGNIGFLNNGDKYFRTGNEKAMYMFIDKNETVEITFTLEKEVYPSHVRLFPHGYEVKNAIACRGNVINEDALKRNYTANYVVSGSFDGIDYFEIGTFNDEYGYIFAQDILLNQENKVKYVKLSATNPSDPINLDFLEVEIFGFEEKTENPIKPLPKHTVTFIVNGETIDSQIIEEGQKVVAPTVPEKEGYLFTGWYSGDVKVNLNNKITKSLELTAKWRLDSYQKVDVNSVAGEESVWSATSPYDNLIDGNISTDCAWGSWGVTDFYQAYIPVTLTLREETIVERVTITLPSNLPNHTIAFTIEASLDNSKWVPVSFIDNTESKIMNNAITVASRSEHVITADFDAVTAKYLKVTVVVKDTNDNSAVSIVNEIEVFKSTTAIAPKEMAFAEKVNYTAEITKGVLADGNIGLLNNGDKYFRTGNEKAMYMFIDKNETVEITFTLEKEVYPSHVRLFPHGYEVKNAIACRGNVINEDALKRNNTANYVVSSSFDGIDYFEIGAFNDEYGYIFAQDILLNQENKVKYIKLSATNPSDPINLDFLEVEIFGFEEKIKYYSVSFDSNGGSYTPNSQIVKQNTNVIEPANPTKSGYTFEGWYNGEVLFDFNSAVENDLTLIAKWAPTSYSITYNLGGGTASGNPETYNIESGEITLTNPTRDGYNFVGWMGTDLIQTTKTVVIPQGSTGDREYVAVWNAISYDVTYNLNGGVGGENPTTYTIESGEITLTNPTRDGYNFVGWIGTGLTEATKVVVIANGSIGNREYTATWAINKYTITFKNDDGSIILEEFYDYGATVVTPSETPKKDADNTYTYTFKSWDKEVVKVNGDAIYTATYTETYIDYTITFVDEDGTEISSKTYHYGEEVEVPENPTKDADNTYTYTFKAWDKEVVNVNGDAIYTATYTATYINYTIIFKNEDGTELSKKTDYHYGDKITAPSNPTKEADNTYTYTFKDWGEEVTTVSGNKTYTATYTENYIEYTVTFKNENGDVISEETYHYNDAVVIPSETPKKDADNTYTYAFKSWDKEVVNVNGDAIYTATYTATYINYTIIFKNEDGTELSKKTDYHYGATVVTPSETPKKDADETYTYTFKAWDKEVVKVNGDAIYTATYTATYINYTIIFKNEDGTELSKKTDYHYGDTITAPSNPTKEADNTYTYTFKDWGEEVSTVSGNKTYTATYNRAYIDYTIKFVDEDGTEISSKTYHYGEEVVVPENPTKEADNTYTYMFKDWGEEVTTVSGDKTYTATYKEKYIDYTVTFKNYNGNVLSNEIYHYGDTVVIPSETPTKEADKTYTYEFKGWDSEVTVVSGNKIYTATYTETYIEYIIRFLDEDGSEISSKIYHFGDSVEEPNVPTKPADNTYTYSFSGWDSEVTTVDGNKEYVATYELKHIDYTVTFKNYNGSVLSSKTYHYGEVVVIPSELPQKASDSACTYTFIGWDKEVVNVNGDAEYVATFEGKYIDYTVTFKNYNGSVLSSKTYHYGDIVVEPNTPTKPADNTYTYTFKDWGEEVITVSGNKEYIATYNRAYINYTIIFKNEDGIELSKKTDYHYGDTVSIPDGIPTKPEDEVYTYTFDAWDKEVIKVEGNATYTATYTKTLKNYTVIFKDYDGTELSKKTDYHYGDLIERPQDPQRDGYDFSYWTIEGENVVYTFNSPVKGNLVLIANWTSKEAQKCVVTFVCYDDNVSTVQVVKNEAVPMPSDPVREGYTFKGWKKNGVDYVFSSAVTEDITLVADWQINTYVIIFKNDDGSVILEGVYDYGATVTAPIAPTKEADNTYTYTFKGWDSEVTIVSGNKIYTATYNRTYIEYTIKFVNADGTEISQKTDYHYGETILVPENPTKEADNTYTYTFNGWGEEITIVSGNKTYTAQYTEKYIDYTIIFKNYNGSVISQKTDYHYGDTITVPANPTKPSTETYKYTFKDWGETVATVSGDKTYEAQFIEQYIEYTIIFKNEDGTELSKKTNYHYGDTITVPANPTKPSTETYKYTFKDWGEVVGTVKGDKTYIATYTESYVNYTIIFKNYNGIVISQKADYHYGEDVVEPTTPIREADNTYTYVFKDWGEVVTTVSGNKTYVAQFTATYIDYTIIFKNYNGSVISQKTDYHYGDTVTAPANPTKPSTQMHKYTFKDWGDTITKVSGDKTYVAQFIEQFIEYTIIFQNYDGSELSKKNNYHYGDQILVPENPIKEADNTYTYTFKDWGEEVTTVSGNKTYTAIYTETYINYTIIFKDYNGAELSKKTDYHYGDTITAPSNPEREADNTYTYTFKDWGEVVSTVSGDKTYTATYNRAYIDYKVTFKDTDGSTITEKTCHYGETIEAPQNPEEEGYTFSGWYNGQSEYDFNSAVTSDLTLTAKWTAISYTISYNLNGGEVDGTNKESYTIESGDITLINPTKEGYTFKGWTGTGLSEATINVTIESGSTGDREYVATWEAVQQGGDQGGEGDGDNGVGGGENQDPIPPSEEGEESKDDGCLSSINQAGYATVIALMVGGILVSIKKRTKRN